MDFRNDGAYFCEHGQYRSAGIFGTKIKTIREVIYFAPEGATYTLAVQFDHQEMPTSCNRDSFREKDSGSISELAQKIEPHGDKFILDGAIYSFVPFK